jgi:hypothetical protein
MLTENFVENFDPVFELFDNSGGRFDAFETGSFDIRKRINKSVVAPCRCVARHLDVSHVF